jgi:hypothetical protein
LLQVYSTPKDLPPLQIYVTSYPLLLVTSTYNVSLALTAPLLCSQPLTLPR